MVTVFSQPPAVGLALRSLEMLIGSQEDLLRNVLRLPVIAGQAGRSRENHILIRTHEGRELG